MTNTNTSLITPLPDWALIEVCGSDAAPFLHNLLTNNLLSLELGGSHLSGFCSPKGRLLASFWVSRPAHDTYHIWISQDLTEDFVKKLTMYRLRSKVEIKWRKDLPVFGEVSQTGLNHTDCFHGDLPSVTHDNATHQRRILAGDGIVTNSGEDLWNLLEVKSGIPRITNSTKDLFVPQMINFESVGGVDFKKGCYPGQEIVARSQYLGTIKRRLKIAHVNLKTNQNLSITPGLEVFSANDPDQHCGIVILSFVDCEKSRYDFQVEMKLSEVGAKLYFQLHQDEDILIQVEDPPYPLISI
jgi:tRNA-modifying protein YgfZ